MYLLYQFIVKLCEPYTLLVVAALALLLHECLRRYTHGTRTRGVIASACCVAGLFAISVPVVSYGLLATLEWQYPFGYERPEGTEAIVVLNAGIHFPDAVRRRAALDFDTQGRCIHAARLYHDGEPCPIVVTGGTEHGGGVGPSCGEVMADFLVELGVPRSDILIEDESLSTYQNALGSRRILEERGLKSVALVTDATHMFRSVLTFQKQGFEVLPSPCRYGATELRIEPRSFLPTPNAALDSTRVFHEWFGLAYYWMRGRV